MTLSDYLHDRKFRPHWGTREYFLSVLVHGYCDDDKKQKLVDLTRAITEQDAPAEVIAEQLLTLFATWQEYKGAGGV
ncbi:hypothetical protein [Paenibacillus chitinolyticus]|uniref:hypothetical protein n=1 Tax=Paenibacillus chitinolyticus TaxID=79263 RepID=UPI001C44B52E|nr:hypothetical protein [Paenibacillus chitinolyticus]MBV6717265.1 hypothetical protein [Paenibacillus chitinolyticus]